MNHPARQRGKPARARTPRLRALRAKHLALLPLLLCPAPHALELGEPVVESVPGETLDARIPLLEISAAGHDVLRLIRTDRAAYAETGLDHAPLHERIVMELVPSATPPHVAVSSIGPVNEVAFNLLVGIVHPNGTLLKPVRIVLGTPPQPPQPAVMTPPEVLARLLALLAEDSGRPHTAVFSELRQLVDGRSYRAGEKRLVMRFLRTGFAPDFVDGVAALLNDDAAVVFGRRLDDGRGAFALSEALFGDGEQAVLGGLLAAGTVSAMHEGENVPQRLVYLKEKIAALENRIVELGHALERAGRDDSGAAPRSRWWNILHAVLAEYGWDNRRLLTRPVWTGFAAFWGVLALLMAWRQWRRLRAAASVARSIEAAVKQPLESASASSSASSVAPSSPPPSVSSSPAPQSPPPSSPPLASSPASPVPPSSSSPPPSSSPSVSPVPPSSSSPVPPSSAVSSPPPPSPGGVLPGQRELERMRGGGGEDAGPGGGQIAGKLHLAYVYIEIGETGKAAALLDEVIRDGDASQVEQARRLQGKLG